MGKGVETLFWLMGRRFHAKAVFLVHLIAAVALSILFRRRGPLTSRFTPTDRALFRPHFVRSSLAASAPGRR